MSPCDPDPSLDPNPHRYPTPHPHLDRQTERVYFNMHNQSVTSITNRQLWYGQEYYGNFLRSLFTLFQVLTGESWSEVVARPLIFGQNELAGPLLRASPYASLVLRIRPAVCTCSPPTSSVRAPHPLICSLQASSFTFPSS